MKYRNRIPLLALAASLLLCSWGFLSHRTISQLSVYQLPASMQPFFHANMEYLVRHSVRPDLRRNQDKTEDTKHFIDLEAFGSDAANKMPLLWKDAVAKYSMDTLVEYGYVPYQVVATKEHLTKAFKMKSADSILFYAADLAHYIADAHVPLHTTLNYDGQLTNQKGLHALWETVVPELMMEQQFNLATAHQARYLLQPEKEIWQAVRKSYALLPSVFGEEKAATQLFTEATKYRIQLRKGKEVKYYTSEFGREYGKRLLPSINERLLASSEMIADFWYTAWVDAGKPDLTKLQTGGGDAGAQVRLKQEVEAFRKNKLLENNWLLSKTGSWE